MLAYMLIYECRKGKVNEMTFKLEKIANMVFVGTDDHIWKAWNAEDFTERKLDNWIKKTQKNFTKEIKVVRK